MSVTAFASSSQVVKSYVHTHTHERSTPGFMPRASSLLAELFPQHLQAVFLFCLFYYYCYYLVYFIFVCVFCLHVCLCATCMPGT